ncbi:soluble guanylate cyclase beta1-like protein [Sarcoptes scabiei]|nr:soluble guanylate cyclase beta1-like protein [Sarcoptes scabiei]
MWNESVSKSNPKPFSKYSFFLDTKNSSHLNSLLQKHIVELGGKIDCFITKNTSCFVTSRPKSEWNNYNCQTESPTPKLILNPNNAFSRGKLLLERTTANNYNKAIDSLELARNLNIKILRSSKLQNFCENHIANLKSAQQKSSAINNLSKKLNPPFIKVIDNSHIYRPNFKELPEWPQLNFDYQPELCPFFKPKNVPLGINNNINVNPNLVQQQQNNSPSIATTTATAYRQLNEKCTMLTTPILTTTGTPQINVGNKSIANTPVIGQTPTTANTTKLNQVSMKKRHMTYCEICHREYSDFEKHLQYENHAQFMQNTENYTELLGVINSLPPFLSKTGHQEESASTKSLYDSAELYIPFNAGEENSAISNDLFSGAQQTNCIAKENKNMSCVKKSSPAMTTSLHSLNAWSSASKHRSFVALHDLFNNNNNDSNPSKDHSAKRDMIFANESELPVYQHHQQRSSLIS